MHDEWREIIATEMEREAKEILDEVNSNPSLKDVQAPKDIKDKLFDQIREYEKQKIYNQLTEEDRELIRLGKVYKRKRTIGRYVAVVMAVVAVLALGSVSMGEGESIPEVISRIFAGREQMVTDSGDTGLSIFNKEDEIYEHIENKYGFYPVRLKYLPENTIFYEGVFGADLQSINIIYEMNNDTSLVYAIWPDYRNGSIGTDIEDKKIQEYVMIVNNVEIKVEEYVINKSGGHKWSVIFLYDDVLYLLRITDINQEEVERIIYNLHFK